MQSEEADTRMFVHIKHAFLAGSQINVILDTHVVVMRFDLLFARCYPPTQAALKEQDKVADIQARRFKETIDGY